MRSPVLLLLLCCAQAWAAKPVWLACDPGKMKFKPTISIGEDQIAPPLQGAKKNPESETYFLSNESPSLDHRVQDASEGRYFLGMQSLYLNESGQKKRKIKLEQWSKARIFGLDHPLPGALAALLRAFAEVKAAPPDKPPKASRPDPSDPEALAKPDPRLLRAKAMFLRALADNSYLRESWKTARKIRGTIPNGREEAVAKIFDRAVEDASLDHEKLVGDLIKDHPWYDRLPFLDLIAGVERGYTTVLRKYEATPRYQMPTAIPPMMEKYFRLEGNLSEVAEPLEKATARWRVLFVASSVSALLCKASEESKNIVALAEPDEVAELKKLLKESFGSSIKVLDARSMGEDEAEPAGAARPSSLPSPNR